MKKNIIVAIITMIIAGILGLSTELVKPVVDKSYCKIKPSECSQQTLEEELEQEKN